MSSVSIDETRRKRNVWALIFIGICIGVNMGLSSLASALGLPIYLDTVGTILAAVVGGYVPGIIVGFTTNFIKGILDPSSIYYGVLNVLVATIVAFFAKKGLLKKPQFLALCTLLLTLVGGGLGTIMPWMINGVSFEMESFAQTIYDTGFLGPKASMLTASLLIDLWDKILSLAIACVAVRLMPERTKEKLQFRGWRQTPLTQEEAESARNSNPRLMSLRTKIVIVLAVSLLAVAVSATAISVVLYRKAIVDDHKVLAKGVAQLAASNIDGDKVNTYLVRGDSEPDYLETKEVLTEIRDSYPDIEYVYVYQIREDGCHVVFDLDTEELKGDSPGTVIPFDESFEDLIPALLAGEEIEPLETNDTYGWLLTVYVPVKDSRGNTVCYAAADISMAQLLANERSFATGVISLFLGFFILILAVVLWQVEYNMILPVNSMALSARNFAYNSEQAREDTLDSIRDLDISTGDEIENLYYAFLRTTEDSVAQVADIQVKSQTILKMQRALVMVLADMVESRDQTTGDHVRKTAAYCDIILRSLKAKHYYEDQISDQFIADVVNSAPLHDIGKISVSDTILNKPGKLTDEEFEKMKTHTTAGAQIIDEVIERVPDSGYLATARELALYHHEKWNGKGYPTGISGDEIPLSARVMAVADVFDALVSVRSYKAAYPFWKAMDIIREGSGSHFDPKVVTAFLAAESEVREVAERFGEHNKQEPIE